MPGGHQENREQRGRRWQLADGREGEAFGGVEGQTIGDPTNKNRAFILGEKQDNVYADFLV